MAVSLYDFFRIGQKYEKLLQALYDKTLNEEELWREVERHGPEGVESETAIAQLEEFEFLQMLEGRERIYRLSVHVERLLGTLLKRQHETSARVIQGFLEAMREVSGRLEESLETRNAERVLMGLRELENLMIAVRELGKANLDSITTQVEELKGRGEVRMTTQERFERVNHLWEELILPLEELIKVRGPFDESLDRIGRLLGELEGRFQHHGRIRRMIVGAEAQLAAMRRELLERHRDVMREVEPLYRRLRRDSTLSMGAAMALKLVRHRGDAGLEKGVELFGWRPDGLMGDDELGAYLATVAEYEPVEDRVIGEPPEAIEPPILRSEEVEAVLREQVPVEDVLRFLLKEWPEKPLKAVLQAYSWIYRAEFGPVEFHRELEVERYECGEKAVMARPISLKEVVR